ncbi:MAG: hypothetical protein HXX11_22925, partial [Desulfuromonadales bacterium]|nr:hypothetical protein [Desulfuromonadales bacterium]
RFTYDPMNNLTAVLAPQGTTSSFSYDALGNLTASFDPMGNQQSFGYGSYGVLTSLTDSLSNMLKYNYDSRYNNTAITYPDGRVEQGARDAHGNPVQWTNRRGRSVTYTYDSHDLLTRKLYGDGSHVDYAYDSHRNLQSLTNSSGTTSFTFDSADRLTGISYPNGRFIQYAYNSSGRRSSMTDQTGFAVHYAYDSAGRLSQLSDGSSLTIVAYTYDSAGRIVRKTLGNGTYTTHAYDPAGNLLQLVNYAANNAVISSYTYTYDSLGRKTGMTAPDGVYSYGYDAAGQLTSVSLPGGGSVQYTYDAAGNRMTTTASGVTTYYSINGLNEYISAGGTTFAYDDDGNLIAKSGAGGTWNYVYDDENRLVGVTGPGNTWTYEYDSLGNRVAQTKNGQRTEYLIDPTGLGNVVAEFGGTGNLLSHYTYGFGLSSTVPSGTTASYYHFDGSGNTAQITGAAGNVLNSYSFLPFGEKTGSSETVSNPFTYVGQYGVRDEGNSLYFMRNRWYDPALGRFTQPDPLGIGGRDANLYRYVGNRPIGMIDPLGLDGVDDGLNYVGYAGTTVSSFQEAGEFGIRMGTPKSTFAVAAQRAKLVAPLQKLGTGLNVIGYVGSTAQFAYTFDKYNHGKATGLDLTHDTVMFAGSVAAFAGPIGDAVSFAMGLTDMVSQIGLDYYFSDYDKAANDPNIWGPRYWEPQKQKPVKVPNSADPNLKTTIGYGTQGYVTGDTPISYTIEFENMASATAPAQKVVVTDQLSAHLDWSTFQLTQIVLNNTTISIPAGLQSYAARTSVPTDPNPVNVTIALNPATGLVTATMESVDPVTGGVPEDPYAGFLPPNNSTHRGEGFVSFTINPKAGLANGTVITNASTIVFDLNAPITTNTVTNTIDSVRPTSRVNFIPSNTVTDSFTVPWGGSENSGSGIAYYDVYVSTDGGQAAVWLPGSSLTSALFSGLAGHEYSFYTLAVDNAGNYQTAPATSQVVITGSLPLVQVDGGATPYRSILSAIGGTGNNSVIKARNAGFSENLLFNSPNSVTLSGGYGGNFSTVVGYTSVQGTLTVKSGVLKIGNIVIQ